MSDRPPSRSPNRPGKKSRPRPAARTDRILTPGSIDRLEQLFGLLDQMPGLVFVDVLAVECRAFQYFDHLSGDLVPPAGEIVDLVLERRIGRGVALERLGGDPGQRLAAQLAERRVDLLVGFRQAR